MQSEFADERIKVKLFSRRNVLGIYVLLMVLSTIPALIINVFYANTTPIAAKLMLGIMIYWGVAALLLCLLVRSYIHTTYDVPIQRLGHAAQCVTQGDFSIHIQLDHPASEANPLDVITDDFNKMVEALGSSEVLKSNFVANVSHEIRTPVAIIENYMDLLERPGVTPQEQHAYLASMRKATGNLVGLTKKILILNQLESHKIPVETQPINLFDQLCGALLQFEAQLDEKQLVIDLDIDESLIIHASPDLLDIVWNSLLSNAVKFTPEGGRITVCAAQETSGVRVTIRDTGCGMNEETLLHAFDKFYQGDISHSGEGNGLGLALAQAAIHLAHGTISITSGKDCGSEAAVYLAQ